MPQSLHVRLSCAQIAIHVLQNVSNLQEERLKGFRKGGHQSCLILTPKFARNNMAKISGLLKFVSGRESSSLTSRRV